MADISHVYPPAPVAVPSDLTTPSRQYRLRVVLVLVCLLVFVLVYLALTAGSAYGCFWCFKELASDEPAPRRTTNPSGSRNYTPPPPREKKPVFILIVGGITFGLISLFMVKGLFKQSRRDEGIRVEVTEEEQPVLFAFIRRVCLETGAPFPHRVFVVPDVNAAVSFHESFLNLIFQSRKNLIIGLALVNRLNLSEFKAVLAHEFGHFSQNSMKLGSYVYTTNRIILDIVYGRDWLDDMLGTLRGTDLRIAVFAWAFTAILWTMRKGLELLFRGINFANVSLSRQMEYNADLVAVRASGSDALIFALARLDFATDSLGQAWADLTAAADHNRFSRDLYYHQTKAAEYLKAKRNDPKLGEVPPLPDDPNETVQVFKPEDLSVPMMWATHPSNYDREMNAKRRYVRGPVDERSAWELFTNADTVREAVTRKIYETSRKAFPGTLEEPEVIQEFIDAEHAEMTYNPKYHGLYENRYIKPGDLAEVCTEATVAAFHGPAHIKTVHGALYSDELKTRMESHRIRGEEANKLAGLAHGAVELTGTHFEHRGERYRPSEAAKLLKDVEAEIDRDFEEMHALDRDVLRVHYTMAVQLGGPDAKELIDWYRFHLAVQEIHSQLIAYSRHVQTQLFNLGTERQVSQELFQNALGAIRETRKALVAQLDIADELTLPPLKNMTPGDKLGPFLLSEKLIEKLPVDSTSLDGIYVNHLMNQMGEVIDKSARILFKSLGGLLALQERIADRWLLAQMPPAEAVADVEPPEATLTEPASNPDENPKP